MFISGYKSTFYSTIYSFIIFDLKDQELGFRSFAKVNLQHKQDDSKNFNEMKKSLFTVMLLVIGGSMYSQVGINTNSPSATLDILSKGNTSSTKAMEVNDSNNKALVNIYDDGNVGINTENPMAKLHIVAASTEKGFQLQDGTQQDGRVLTSNANGVGTWQPFQAWGESTTVNMSGTQTFATAPNAASGTPTTFNPATTPTIVGTDTIGITFPSNSRIKLPAGRYLVFVRTDLAGSEFVAFSAWRNSTGIRLFYSYYGDFLANPSFIVDFRDSPTGDSLYFQALGLTNNPSPTYYDANYTNNNWGIVLTILKIS